MQLPSRNLRRHDPFWDLDGKAARRSRYQRRFLRSGLVVLAAIFVAVVVARLPSFDPQLITTNGSLRPVLAVSVYRTNDDDESNRFDRGARDGDERGRHRRRRRQAR